MIIKKLKTLDNLRAKIWTSRGHRVLLCLNPHSGFTANDLLKRHGRAFAEHILNQHIRRAAMERYPNGSMSITVFRDKVYYGLSRYCILSLEKTGHLEWYVFFVDGTAGTLFMTDEIVDDYIRGIGIFTTDIENTWTPYRIYYHHTPSKQIRAGMTNEDYHSSEVYDILKHGNGMLPDCYVKDKTAHEPWDPFDMRGLKPIARYKHGMISGIPITMGNLGGRFSDWKVNVYYKERIKDPLMPVFFVGPANVEYAYFPDIQEFDNGKASYTQMGFRAKLPPEDLAKAIREYCANTDNLAKLREEYYREA